jgi:hypothetical protein
VPLTIRAPSLDELSGLSDLCFRSKAVWGYDDKFMEACRGELSFEPRDLELTPIAVAELNGKSIGVAQIRVVDGEADLLNSSNPRRFAAGPAGRYSLGLPTSRKNWVPRD